MGSTIVIGITGLIASGKSHILECFKNLGAKTLDSDKIVHDLIENQLKEQLLREFGTIDRRELGKIVYENPDKLKKLESIIHPEVRKENLEFIENNQGNLIVLEIPMLFETNAQKICDYTIFVDVSRETILKRALNRPNMSEEKLERILIKQTEIENKKELADFVIYNDEESDSLKQVKEIYNKICAK